ncbi:MAG TPA: 5-formyltetrahydrofolate cyclo-ligase [Caulobacteraceae bacterium]
MGVPEFDLRAWRKVERARLIEARMALPLDEHKAASAAIAETLTARFPAAAFGSLGCYWPFRREYDCIPLMRQVIEAGGQVSLPVVLHKNHPLEFRPWTPGARMEAGVWNIMHPAEGISVQPAALLIPLVGFDARGYRLGYGAGFYDRTIALFETPPLKIGVGFELSRLDTIFPQDHDIPMDVIVTEKGVVFTDGGAL